MQLYREPNHRETGLCILQLPGQREEVHVVGTSRQRLNIML